MKKLTTFFLFAVLFSSLFYPAYGKNSFTDSTAAVVSHWKKGERINLTIDKQRTKHQAGQLIFDEGSTYEATLTVVDSTEEGYVIEWVYEEVKLNNPNPNPLAKKLIALTNGMQARYLTDKSGAFRSLLNWQEIQEFAFKAVDAVLSEFNDPSLVAAFNQTKSLFSSQQSIEQLAIKEIRLYHSLYGKAEYTLNQALEIATQMPNMLGGDPFPAIMTIEMTELNPAANFCKIQMTQVLDQEKTTRAIFDFMKKMAADAGQPLPTEQDLPLIAVKDRNEFKVDLQSGWLTQISTSRETLSADVKQIDSYEIRLLK